jgi:hypothetical protein
MAGTPRRSGGSNRLNVEQHLSRSTFRPERHGVPSAGETGPVSEKDRRPPLRGLPVGARRVAVRLLRNTRGGTPSLEALRAYSLGCVRFASVTDHAGRRHEGTASRDSPQPGVAQSIKPRAARRGCSDEARESPRTCRRQRPCLAWWLERDCARATPGPKLR